MNMEIIINQNCCFNVVLVFLALCDKKYEEISKAIKKSREAGFMPFITKEPAFMHDKQITVKEKDYCKYSFFHFVFNINPILIQLNIFSEWRWPDASHYSATLPTSFLHQ